MRSLWQRVFNRACDLPRNSNFVERDRRPSAVIPTMKPKFVRTMHISFARLSIDFRVFKCKNTLKLQLNWTLNLLQCSTRKPYRLSHSIFEDLVHEKCLAEASTLQVRSLIGSSTWVQNSFFMKNLINLWPQICCYKIFTLPVVFISLFWNKPHTR